MIKRIKIGTIGCGHIGTGLLSLLAAKRELLKGRFGLEIEVDFISGRSRGTLAAAGGVDIEAASRALRDERSLLGLAGAVREPIPLGRLLDDYPVDAVCEMAPTDVHTGEPGLSVMREALSRGISVVTSSKGALVVAMAELKELAAKNGASLRFESSVMAGTPVLNLARGPLAGCEIKSVRGIVNGTTNYILTKMGQGTSYADALAEAQRSGFAEADPSGDVDGWDAAAKACILSGELFGANISIDDVDRTGISDVSADDVARARADGRAIRLIAAVTREGASVRPELVAADDPLAGVDGAANALIFKTDDLGEITIMGRGAGPRETASGLLSDLIELYA